MKQRHGCLIVPDATKDDRFKDNALVTGGPEIRFYAGVPLLTPEGEKVGSFCIIDTKPRPNGLTAFQISQLEMFAREAVLYMVTR